jgi:hypothetical protein
MSVLVVETGEGLSNANSFATAAEGTTFFSERPSTYIAEWTNATDPNKEAALIWATRLIDEQVNWYGAKATQAQRLRWPRYGVFDRDGYQYNSNVVPEFLKHATCEQALALLKEDRTADAIYGFSSIDVGSIQIEIDKYNYQPILSDAVRSILRAYGTFVSDAPTSYRVNRA